MSSKDPGSQCIPFYGPGEQRLDALLPKSQRWRFCKASLLLPFAHSDELLHFLCPVWASGIYVDEHPNATDELFIRFRESMNGLADSKQKICHWVAQNMHVG